MKLTYIANVFKNYDNPVTRLIWEYSERKCVQYIGRFVRIGRDNPRPSRLQEFVFRKVWVKIEKRTRDFLFKGRP